MIPTVPGSEVDFQTPQRTVHLDAGALTASARARMSAAGEDFSGRQRVTGAIGEVGESFGGIANDLMKANQARIAADADFKMRAAQQSFVESLRGDGHEGGWAERAQGVYDKVRDEVFSGSVPPVMRQQLDQQLRGWGQSLQMRAQTMAAVQSINRAEVAIKKSYEEAGRDGDAVGMANAVALGRQSKLDPVAMDELENNIPRGLALTAIETGLRTNPQGTHDLLVSGASLPITDQNGKPIIPSKVFPQKELQGLVKQARSTAEGWQKDNVETMLMVDADPITGRVPDQVIEQKMKAKEISEKTGRALIASNNRALKADARELAKEDKDNYDLAVAHARASDTWSADPNQTANDLMAEVANISSPILRQRALNVVNHQLAAVKKTGEVEERPILREALGRGKEAFEHGLFQPVPQYDSQWQQFTTEKDRNAANLAYAKWQDKVREFVKDNPNAKAEEIERYSQGLMQGNITDSLTSLRIGSQTRETVGGASTTEPTTRADVTKAQWESLKPGEKFWWNGKQYTK